MDSASIGKSFGPFTVQRVLGRGGMGVVYEAYEPALDRRVALKLVREDVAQQKEYVTRFQREARLAARVNHPNLVTVYAADFREGLAYLAMEFVEGETLSEVLRRRGALPVREALHIAREVASGLTAIHGAGMIHRDVKPANIMVESCGRVRVMDFGLAKPLEDNTQLTQGPAYLGTPRYMAPEQYRGEAVCPATDLYALGVTLYEMLKGEHPFQSSNQAELIRLVLDKGAEPISFYRPDAGPAVEELVSRLLSRPASARYPNASAVVLAIDSCLANSQDQAATLLAPTNREPSTIAQERLRPLRSSAYMNAVLGAILVAALLVPHGLGDTKYLFLGSRARNNNLVLIDAGIWPPKNEEAIAELVRLLGKSNAPVIGLDLILDAETSLASPETLKEPLRLSGNVVLASDLNGGEIMPGLSAVAAGTGFANVPTDWDGTVRRAALTSTGDATGTKSFALRIVEQYWTRKRPGQRGTPEGETNSGAGVVKDLPREFSIDFGALRENQIIPLSQVSEIATQWNSAFCQDKVFVVGTSSSGDIHKTPLWGVNRRIAGLALQGCILDNLLSGHWLVRPPLWAHTILLTVVAILGIAGGNRLGPIWLAPLWLGFTGAILLTAGSLLRYYSIVCPVAWPIVTVIAASSLSVWRKEKCSRSLRGSPS